MASKEGGEAARDTQVADDAVTTPHGGQVNDG